jgi:tetratricopeptide (TPR) repeat protein
MGKSRLVWELEKYLDGIVGPQLYYWHQGRSPAYGEGITYWALGEMVRRRAGIAEGEDEVTTREKLRGALEQFVTDADERAWLEPALGALLGVADADASAQSREQLYSAWRTFFERVAANGPVVLVFEDIQWADGGLLDFIDHMLDWSRNAPILIVTLARPEILERRPNLGVGHRAFAAVHLEPLTDEAMRALLTGLVPTLPGPELDGIVARAEGVPLYAVETIRTLVDQGYLRREGNAYAAVGDLPTIGIPPTLRALIAARLDALDAPDRDLVQNASVIGTVFAVPRLAALAGRSEDDVTSRLRALCSRELVALETDPRSPERGQYRFTQALLREVAYNTLGKRERRARHLAAARYLETLGDDELAGVLATHYAEAYRAAPEGAEGAAIAAQARVALRAAGDRGAALHSYDQALAYYEQALAVTFDEATRVELMLSAALAAQSSGALTRSAELYESSFEWLLEHGQTERAAAAASDFAQTLLIGSHIDEAMLLVDRALAAVSADSPAAVDLYQHRARGYLFRQQAPEALRVLDVGLDIAERHGMRRNVVHLLITKSWALKMNHRPAEGTALLVGALRMADEGPDLLARTRARFNLVGYLVAQDPRQALDVAVAGMEENRQFGYAVHVTNMAGNAAPAAFLLGEFDQLLRLEADTESFEAPMSATVHGYASLVLALRGDWDAVRERKARVDRVMAGTSSDQDQSWLRYQESVRLLAAGRVVEARDEARRGRDAYFGSDAPLAASLAAHLDTLMLDRDALLEDRAPIAESFILGSWFERHLRNVDAALAAFDGRRDEARTMYQRVIDEWRSAGVKVDLALTLLERARLLPGDDDAAAAHAEAESLFEEMGIGAFFKLLSDALGPARVSSEGTTAAKESAVTPKDAAAATR